MKLVCLVLAGSLTGCSFFMTSGPVDSGNPPRAYPSCTQSMTWPIVDTVLTGLFVAAMVGAIADDDSMSTSEDGDSTRAEQITSSILFAGLAGTSAYVGYNRVSRCRGANERFHAAYPNGMPAYQPYPYQPYYPQPYPAAQPQPQPYPPQPVAQPEPPPPAVPAGPVPPATVPTALGTEGDVCASSSECATGLTCTSNVCIRPAPK